MPRQSRFQSSQHSAWPAEVGAVGSKQPALQLVATSQRPMKAPLSWALQDGGPWSQDTQKACLTPVLGTLSPRLSTPPAPQRSRRLRGGRLQMISCQRSHREEPSTLPENEQALGPVSGLSPPGIAGGGAGGEMGKMVIPHIPVFYIFVSPSQLFP